MYTVLQLILGLPVSYPINTAVHCLQLFKGHRSASISVAADQVSHNYIPTYDVLADYLAHGLDDHQPDGLPHLNLAGHHH